MLGAWQIALSSEHAASCGHQSRNISPLFFVMPICICCINDMCWGGTMSALHFSSNGAVQSGNGRGP